MISHQYKCIFIHIPKTAGTSIEKKLDHFTELKDGVQDHRPVKLIEPYTLSEVVRGVGTGNKSKKAKYELIRNYFRPLLTRSQYKTYFKFTFVRNPWDRVYSWYKNVLRYEPHQQSLGIGLDCSFEDFLLKYGKQWALQPQLTWIKRRDGRIEMDFIGRFENLENDFAYVAEKIGLENCELPQMLVSNNERYTKSYDSRLIDFVGEKYREEIELFGYKFGD